MTAKLSSIMGPDDNEIFLCIVIRGQFRKFRPPGGTPYFTLWIFDSLFPNFEYEWLPHI